jgi:hypothetical protein
MDNPARQVSLFDLTKKSKICVSSRTHVAILKSTPGSRPFPTPPTPSAYFWLLRLAAWRLALVNLCPSLFRSSELMPSAFFLPPSLPNLRKYSRISGVSVLVRFILTSISCSRYMRAMIKYV